MSTRLLSLLLFSLCLFFLFAFDAHFAHASDKDPAFNLSSLTWATAKDTDTLERDRDREQMLNLVDESTEDGGFSSLDGMLQWAIGHSDPEKLKGVAQEVQNLTASELEKRQAEIRELMEKLRVPSDADLMKVAIEDLQNSSLSAEHRQRALQELLELVEPIDNANDLDKLGGLSVVVNELDREEEDLRISAAWILGKASQNNDLVQSQLLQLGVLPRLMEMVHSSGAEEAVKAFYAISAIIRNHPSAQKEFYHHGGMSLLEDLMRNASSDIRLLRKSLFLVADLAEQEWETGGAIANFQPSRSFCMAVVNLVAAPDLDTQEKALMAIRSLGNLGSATHDILKNDCEVKSTLEKVQLQLDDLKQGDEELEFVKDLQALCQMVKSIFSDDGESKSLTSDKTL